MDIVRKIASYAVFQMIGFRPTPVSAQVWDREYKSGRWDYLGALDNLGGLASVLGYCQFLEPAAILDVGCGAGLLAKKLKVLPYKSYLGVDLSAEAIAQAAPVADARTAFAVAEAGDFHSDRQFDVVIFCQILNYIPDPDAVLGALCPLPDAERPDHRLDVQHGAHPRRLEPDREGDGRGRRDVRHPGHRHDDDQGAPAALTAFGRAGDIRSPEDRRLPVISRRRAEISGDLAVCPTPGFCARNSPGGGCCEICMRAAASRDNLLLKNQ